VLGTLPINVSQSAALGGLLRDGNKKVKHIPFLSSSRYNTFGLYQMTATVVLTLYLDILFGARTRRHHWAQKQ